MVNILGILSLIFGIISLAPSSFSYFWLPLTFRILIILITLIFAGIVLVCGGIGIKKDDGNGLAKIGLVLSSIAIINFIVGSLVSSLIYG
jgi:hypothetical protein